MIYSRFFFLVKKKKEKKRKRKKERERKVDMGNATWAYWNGCGINV
jgi:hypothetical protein